MPGRKVGAFTNKPKWLVIHTNDGGENVMEYFNSCRHMKEKYDFIYPNLLKLMAEKTTLGRDQLRKHKKLPYDNLKVYKLPNTSKAKLSPLI